MMFAWRADLKNVEAEGRIAHNTRFEETDVAADRAG